MTSRFTHVAAVLAFALAVAGLGAASPPARANVFCPATVATVEDLATLGRADTYGVMIDLDPGDATSVRLRVDSQTTSYAVDFDDLGPVGAQPMQADRYFVMPPRERVVAAWIESTGTNPAMRTECPITSPYEADAPAPFDPKVALAKETERRTLLDGFSTQTPTVTPKSFGSAQPLSCAQPYVPPSEVLAVPAQEPPEARAVRAVGAVVVRIDLDETSNVVDGLVVRSSGFAPLDRAALAAALKSSYRTETFACRPIASTYEFTVTFSGG